MPWVDAPHNHLFRRKFKSLWDFWRDGVTSSFLNSFVTCREQTRLSYVEGWASRNTPIAFEFGTCIHWILEQMYGYVKPIPQLKAMVPTWVKQYEKLWKTLNPSPHTKQIQTQELIYGMAEALLPVYISRWDGDFTGKYTHGNKSTHPKRWVKLEEVFKVPYTFPDGAKTFFTGRRDALFADRSDDLWVFDTKCRSIINNQTALECLPFDLQQRFYVTVTHLEMILSRESKPLMGKKFPKGVIMNIVRRPGHRRGINESLRAFLERIREDVSRVKNLDHNFIRYEMALTPKEITDWQKETLDPLMQDVRAWWEGSAPHYMNPNSLETKYGTCPLYLPIVKQDFTYCHRRRVAFSELAN